MQSLPKYVSLRLAQLSTSLLSLAGSSIIAFMILKREDKLSSPHRRIVFGLSIADAIHVFALFTGPFLTPADTQGAYWAFGNDRTCDINGFFLVLGGSAVPMYTFMLCLYFLFKVKRNMTDDEFYKKVEKKMHIGIIAYNLILSITLVATKQIESDVGRGFCSYLPPPPSICDHNADGIMSCARGLQSKLLGLFAFYIPTMACFIGIFASMVSLCFVVYSQERRNGSYRPSERSQNSSLRHSRNTNSSLVSSHFGTDINRSNSQYIEEDDTERLKTGKLRRLSFGALRNKASQDKIVLDRTHRQSSVPNETPSLHTSRAESMRRVHRRVSFQESRTSLEATSEGSRPKRRVSFADVSQSIRETLSSLREEGTEDQGPLANYVSRGERKSRARRKETAKQAMLYVAVFFITYGWPLTYEWTYMNFPFAANILFYLFYPLGGFFNILVYTRQRVATVRKRNSCSWIKGVWEVAKAGGDVPHYSRSRNRNHRARHRASGVTRRGSTTQNQLSGNRGVSNDTERADNLIPRRINPTTDRGSRRNTLPPLHFGNGRSLNSIQGDNNSLHRYPIGLPSKKCVGKVETDCTKQLDIKMPHISIEKDDSDSICSEDIDAAVAKISVAFGLARNPRDVNTNEESECSTPYQSSAQDPESNFSVGDMDDLNNDIADLGASSPVLCEQEHEQYEDDDPKQSTVHNPEAINISADDGETLDTDIHEIEYNPPTLDALRSYDARQECEQREDYVLHQREFYGPEAIKLMGDTDDMECVVEQDCTVKTLEILRDDDLELENQQNEEAESIQRSEQDDLEDQNPCINYADNLENAV